jgi:FdhD protein
MQSTFRHSFTRLDNCGGALEVSRQLAVEAPVAVEINGFNYAVLMASPCELVDLAYGFLLSERLVERSEEIIDVAPHQTPHGCVLRVAVTPSAFARVDLRVRHRTSDSSCGLCGIESLEQALRPLPELSTSWHGRDEAIFDALAKLEAWQALNRATGAVHAAARCTGDGRIVELREDVGRHNAFDKLIGAMLRSGESWGDGFALLTSRCSYELVEKAVLSGCPMLATISAPTDLAVRRAAQSGLALRALARSDALFASALT